MRATDRSRCTHCSRYLTFIWPQEQNQGPFQGGNAQDPEQQRVVAGDREGRGLKERGCRKTVGGSECGMRVGDGEGANLRRIRQYLPSI